jgi:hypothetical protein
LRRQKIGKKALPSKTFHIRNTALFLYCYWSFCFLFKFPPFHRVPFFFLSFLHGSFSLSFDKWGTFSMQPARPKSKQRNPQKVLTHQIFFYKNGRAEMKKYDAVLFKINITFNLSFKKKCLNSKWLLLVGSSMDV